MRCNALTFIELIIILVIGAVIASFAIPAIIADCAKAEAEPNTPPAIQGVPSLWHATILTDTKTGQRFLLVYDSERLSVCPIAQQAAP